MFMDSQLSDNSKEITVVNAIKRLFEIYITGGSHVGTPGIALSQMKADIAKYFGEPSFSGLPLKHHTLNVLYPRFC